MPENVDVSQYRALPSCMYCPHCNICFAENGFEYAEEVQGREYGHANFGNGEIEHEVTDSETYNYLQRTYSCATCEGDINREIIDRCNRITDAVNSTILDLRRVEGHSDAVWCFKTPEIVEIMKDLALRNEIGLFNWNHPVYNNGEAIVLNVNAGTNINTIEEPNPMNSMVRALNHHRRYRDQEILNGVECPCCKHIFVADPNEQEFSCPSCRHEWERV